MTNKMEEKSKKMLIEEELKDMTAEQLIEEIKHRDSMIINILIHYIAKGLNVINIDQLKHVIKGMYGNDIYVDSKIRNVMCLRPDGILSLQELIHLLKDDPKNKNLFRSGVLFDPND